MKPFYIDFSSPIYVNILAKMIRRTAETGQDAEFAITEMLPSHDEIWLPDSKGQRFTSEFRIVALDLQPESDSRQHSGTH
jgi:hypothetical protein